MRGKFQALVNMPRLVLKYYLFRAAAGTGFFWPIFTFFLLSRGLSFTEIALLHSMEALLVLTGEIPTGYVSDRIGRRNSLIVSRALFVAQVVGFVFAETFAQFAVLWALFAFSQTFKSGAGDAWLYDVLKERLDESEYSRILGRGGAINQFTTATAMLTAGVLYQIEPTLPFVVGATVSATGIVLLFLLPKTQQYTNDEEDALGVRETLPLIRESMTSVRIRSVVLYIALFAGVIRAVDVFIQPIVVNTIGFSETSLGPLYAGFSVVAAIAGYFAGDIEERLTRRWALVLIPAFMGVFLIFPLAIPVIAVPAFFVRQASSAVVFPVATGYINDHTKSLGRATILSAVAMVFALARIPLQPIGGFIADVQTPLVAVAALGGIALGGFAIIFLWETPATSQVAEATE